MRRIFCGSSRDHAAAHELFCEIESRLVDREKRDLLQKVQPAPSHILVACCRFSDDDLRRKEIEGQPPLQPPLFGQLLVGSDDQVPINLAVR